MDWRPSASIDTLRSRAAILCKMRKFFALRDVLEVETPTLSAATITDIHLDVLQTQQTPPQQSLSQQTLPQQRKPSTLYLHTSPEFAMKRLLAAGAPDIFQICKCFREDEVGRLHNPEFTMLEWYRRDFSMQTLIQEVGDLLRDILDITIIEQFTFQQIFIQLLAFDPLSVDMKTLQRICDQYGYSEYINQLGAQGFTGLPLKDAMLQVLFSEHIEPRIAQHNPVCITHFPASQASLAKLAPCKTTALRFEFYFRGIELANGFEELSDAQVQYQRFIDDNQIRQQLGKSTRPIDHRLIDALHAGLPECSGVALGVDRLIMLAVEANSLSEVISFDIQRA